MTIVSKAFYKGLILAGNAMQKDFYKYTENAFEVNSSVLFNILDENKDTLYGSNHQFKSIKNIDEYKNKIPLNEYSDFEKFIISESKGKKNILTKEDVEYFGHSSGTTGSQKLLPITKTSKNMTLKLNGILCQKFVYDCFKNNWTYGRGAMLIDMNSGTKSEGGMNVTSASSGGMRTIKGLVEYVWTSPVEVMEIVDKDIAFYLHVLFALKEKKLMYIGGLFISSILDFFRFIEKNSDMLINDLMTGKINKTLRINPEIRKILNKKLGRCPKRASELKIEFNRGFDGIAKRIWPKILYIATVTGANFVNYNDMVKKYTGNLPICSIAYAATEAFIGINPYYDKIEYVVLPQTCFYEFIEKDDIYKKNPKTYLINEVKINHDYEIVITTFNGLYRYRLGDVVKVSGFYNQSPKIKFLYRKNQLLNMVAEKTTESHVKNALQSVAHDLKFNLIDYTTYADNSITPGRYLIYLEVENFNSKDGIYIVESKLDLALQKSNLAYGRFRNKNRLGKLKVRFVKRGTFARLKKNLTKNTGSANQIKIPRVIYDKKVIESL
ncbi:MAG: GH3 auxin-responsive promoter family protein [Clostridium sp.]|nr:GH3 auxin-responsive promoter family protein [Clostridium sp.]